MANRFTQITPARFNPLSAEEILAVPLAKQQQHDIAQAQAAQLADANINRLAVDDPAVTAEIEKLRTTQREIEDQLMTEGVGKGINKKLLGLRRDRQEFLDQGGLGGRAQLAFDQYKANEKAILANKNLSQRQKDLGLKFALNRYTQSGGAIEGAVYDPYMGADQVDIQQRAMNFAKEIQPQELTNIAENYGWFRNSDGTWRNNNVTYKVLPATVIERAVQDYLLGDEKVVSYLQDIQRIGLVQDAGQLVRQAAISAGNAYTRLDFSRKQDMKFQPGYFTGDGKKVSADDTFYSYDSIVNRVNFRPGMIDALIDVAEGNEVPVDYTIPMGAGAGSLVMPPGARFSDITGETEPSFRQRQERGISTFENRFNENELEEINNIYDKIIASGWNNTTDDPNRTEQQIAAIVGDYMQENRNLVYKNAHIETNMILGPIDSSMLVNTKDAKSQSEAISKRMKRGRARVWDKNGELIEPKEFLDAEIEYVGYVSADNGIQGLENANEDGMVMPHLAYITPKGESEGKEVYVERSIFEMKGNPNQINTFNANKIIKRITSESTKLPGLNHLIPIPDNPSFNMARVRFIKGATSPEDQFIVQYTGPAGTTKVAVLTRDRFKNSIYKLYGVNPN